MDRILWPMIAATALHALLLIAYVAALGGDPSVLVCVASDRAGRPPFEAVQQGLGKDGYDGQFYYALARAPWKRHEAGLDAAGFRQVRILYPVVSWLLSGGDARRLLWVMPLVNLLAIAGLTGLGAFAARHHGLSPWWGVLLPLALNVAMPAFRDLTDVLSTFAVCGLLVGWLRRCLWWELTLWAAAALFCREQNLVVVVALLAVAAAGGTLSRPFPHQAIRSASEGPRKHGTQWRHGRTCAGLAGVLLLWVAWVGAVWALYGTWPFHTTQTHHFGWPLAGMLHRLQQLDQLPSRASALVSVGSLLLIVVEVGLAVYLLRFRPDPLVALVALGGATLAILGSFILYEDHWSYSRVFALLPLGLWLGCVQVRWRWPLVVMSASFVVPLAALAKAWTQGV
jgi:hypothetical protein